MEDSVKANPKYAKKRKWYNHPSFPLIPQLTIKKACKGNTGGFTFCWMFIKLWSLDAFGFEVSLVIDDHWGIGVNGNLPWLKFVFAIPCPAKWQLWIMKHLWRKSKSSKECENY